MMNWLKKVIPLILAVLLKKTDYNAQTKDIEDKTSIITNLAINDALTVVENKIPFVNALVRKVDYGNKIKEIKSEYFTTSYYNKFTNNILNCIFLSRHVRVSE